MINNKRKKGQSVIEVVFSVGVLVLVLGGVTALLISSVSGRTQGFDRKKATELAEVVIEGLVAEKRNNSDGFWDRQNLSGETNPSFVGYTYNVGFSGVDDTSDCVGVDRRCFYVEVVVNWQRDEEKSISFGRYFTNRN